MSTASDEHSQVRKVTRKIGAPAQAHGARDALPSGNTPEAVEFLQRWQADTGAEFVSLSASHTDPVTGKKGLWETRCFASASDAAGWINERQGKANIYFAVNPTSAAQDKKSAQTDVARVSALQVDVDPRVGEEQAAAPERIIKMFESYKVPPSVIIASGGGAQAFWPLEEPIEIGGDVERAEDAKLFNIQLERDFGGDNCHSIDHVMRLPGTVNIPTATKLKKGRKPALARLHSYTGTKSPLSAFTKAKADSLPEGSSVRANFTSSGDHERNIDPKDERFAQLGPKWTVFGFNGDVEGTYKGDRSRAAYAWVCQAVRAELPESLIADCLLDWKIGEYLHEKKNIDREVNRIIERGRLHAVDADLAEMNDRYAVVNVQGKTKIMTELESPYHLGGYARCYSSFDDFKNLHSNRTKHFVVNDEKKSVPIGAWWLSNKNRRQYNGGIKFMPDCDEAEFGDDSNRVMNLWKGFRVSPRKGDCSLYLDHLKNNICGGNQDYYDYLIPWMANAVQNRGTPGYVAVCLRGGKGTGKGFAIRTFGHLFGPHFLQVTNPDHLTGKFNEHLEAICILFADECFFAGNPKHEQILKVLVTEPNLIIEPKGFKAYTAPNYLHILMASNSEWIVPASGDERRYFVLDVGAGSQQDGAYFDKIEDQMNAGGYEALLDLLMGIDLTEWNVRKVPQTDALAAQKEISSSPLIDSLVELKGEESDVEMYDKQAGKTSYFEIATSNYILFRYLGCHDDQHRAAFLARQLPGAMRAHGWRGPLKVNLKDGPRVQGYVRPTAAPGTQRTLPLGSAAGFEPEGGGR